MARRLPDAPVFNVCTGKAVSVLDLAATIGRLHGVAPRVAHGPARLGDIRHSVGDRSRSRTVLGLPSPIVLQTGLRSVLGSG